MNGNIFMIKLNKYVKLKPCNKNKGGILIIAFIVVALITRKFSTLFSNLFQLGR